MGTGVEVYRDGLVSVCVQRQGDGLHVCVYSIGGGLFWERMVFGVSLCICSPWESYLRLDCFNQCYVRSFVWRVSVDSLSEVYADSGLVPVYSRLLVGAAGIRRVV